MRALCVLLGSRCAAVPPVVVLVALGLVMSGASAQGNQTTSTQVGLFTNNQCDPQSFLASFEMQATGTCETLSFGAWRVHYNLTFDADQRGFNVTSFKEADCAEENGASWFPCAECVAVPQGLLSLPTYLNASCLDQPTSGGGTRGEPSFASASISGSSPNLAVVSAISAALAVSFLLATALASAFHRARMVSEGKRQAWWDAFSLQTPADPTCRVLALRVDPGKRVLVTVLLGVCLVMFAVGDTAEEAVVHLKAEIDDPDLAMFDRRAQYTVNLFNSIQVLWDNGSKGLSALIAVTSFGWPYFKLACLLVVWLLPIAQETTGTVLFWLDALGKWAMVDMYSVVVMVTALYLRADMTQATNTPYVVTLEVETRYGLHVFVSACVMMVLTTQVMVDVHKRFRQVMARRRSSMTQRLSQNLVRSGVLTRPSTFAFITVTAICATGVLLASFFVDFIKLEYTGLVGDVHTNTTLGGEPKIVTLFSVGADLGDVHYHSSSASNAGVGFLTFVYFAVSLVLPLALVALILVLLLQHKFGGNRWWGSKSARRRALQWMEWLLPFMAVDVLFVVGAFSGTAFENLLASVIGELEEEIAKLTNLTDDLLHIRVSLFTSSWLMLVAVLLVYAVSGAMVALVRWRKAPTEATRLAVVNPALSDSQADDDL